MDINKNYNCPNFNSIKIKRNDAIKVNKLINRFRSEQSPAVYEDLVDVFKPYVEKESVKLAGNKYDRRDIAQDLYLNIIELFRTSDEKACSASTLVSELNEMNATKYKAGVQRTKISKLTPEDNMLLSCRQELDVPETPEEKVTRMIKTTPSLSMRDKEIIRRYRFGESRVEIGYIFGLTPVYVTKLLDKCVHNIKNEHFPEYKAKNYTVDNFPVTWKL